MAHWREHMPIAWTVVAAAASGTTVVDADGGSADDGSNSGGCCCTDWHPAAGVADADCFHGFGGT